MKHATRNSPAVDYQTYQPVAMDIGIVSIWRRQKCKVIRGRVAYSVAYKNIKLRNLSHVEIDTSSRINTRIHVLAIRVSFRVLELNTSQNISQCAKTSFRT